MQVPRPPGRETAVDLDATDELPSLAGLVDETRLEWDETLESVPRAEAALQARRLAVPEPPTLTDSVRDVERWVAEQRARVDASEREIARLREAEAEALLRTSTLAAELAGSREVLASERRRADELAGSLATQTAALDALRQRHAELVDRARYGEGEAAALARTLETRDHELADALRAVGERDAALIAARAEADAALAAARTEADATLTAARTEANARLEALRESTRAEIAALRASAEDAEATARAALDLAEREARDSAATAAEVAAAQTARIEALEAGFASSQMRIAELATALDGARVELADALTRAVRAESARTDLESELAVERERAAALLERVNTREFSRGALAALVVDRESELDEVRGRLRALESERERTPVDLASDRDRAIGAALEERDRAIAAAHEERDRAVAAALQERDRGITAALQERDRAIAELGAERDRARAALQARLDALQAEHELQRSRLEEVEAFAAEAVRSASGNLDAVERFRERAELAEHALETRGREADALAVRVRELEARLEDVESPRRALEDDLARARAELALRSERHDAEAAAHRETQAELQRTRGALEERDLQLRRLERSAATSAYALGRIKTSIEQGAPPLAAPTLDPPSAPLASATLTRNDGTEAPVALGRTTRIGRARDNDVCIDAASVSRHHAMVVVGLRGTYVEDLKSTNGVRVNGRRVARQKLLDGDVVAIGDVEFTFRTSPAA